MNHQRLSEVSSPFTLTNELSHLSILTHGLSSQSQNPITFQPLIASDLEPFVSHHDDSMQQLNQLINRETCFESTHVT